MRKVLLVIAVFSLVIIAMCFHRRIYQDEEARIKEIIEEMRVAGEAKRADGIIKWFSNDYSDKSGNNKFIYYQLIMRTLDAVEEIKVEIKDVDVIVAGDRAWATLTVTTEAIRKGKIIFPFGSDQNPETPRLTFKKTATGDWSITRIDDVKSRGL